MSVTKLFNRNFTIMVIGQIISLFGNVALRFALSLFILEKTGSGTIFGTILAISIIPTLFFSPVGGVLADRVSRKRIMVVLDFITAGIITLFMLVVNSDSVIIYIAIIMILLSLIQCFYQPSVQASIPNLASDENLMSANGIVMQVNAIANLVGPILGGILYGAFGLTAILIISASCFFISAVMEIFLHIPFVKLKMTKSPIKTVFDDLKIGVKFMMVKDKIILKILLSIALFNLFISCFISVGVPYLLNVFFGLGSNYVGIAQACLGVGAILGGLSVGLLSKKIKFHKLYITLALSSLVLLPICFFVTGTGMPIIAFVVIAICSMLCNYFGAIYSIMAQTVMQQMTPNHLMGKVAAIVGTICMCAFPIGQTIYGVLLDVLSTRLYIIIAIAVVCGVVISFINKKQLVWFKNNEISQIEVEGITDQVEEAV